MDDESRFKYEHIFNKLGCICFPDEKGRVATDGEFLYCVNQDYTGYKFDETCEEHNEEKMKPVVIDVSSDDTPYAVGMQWNTFKRFLD